MQGLQEFYLLAFQNLRAKVRRGCCVIDMSNLAKLRDTTYQELAKALEVNTGLQIIDMRGNQINEACMTELFESLAENLVLEELKVDVMV